MNLFSARSDRMVLRCGLAAACGWLAVVAVAAPARGQCDPQEISNLLASDAPAAGDAFGYSVAVSGDTAVVGAFSDNDAGGLDSGSAYVFVRSGGVWVQQAKLTALDAGAIDFFGYSVAVSGDTAVVGAFADNHAGGSDAGSAYVFVRTGGAWTQQAKLIGSDTTAGDSLGIAVAVDGDTAVVGAFGDDHPGASNAGSAYVFVRSGTVWTQQAKMIASDAAANDEFGSSLALSGNTAVVGASRDDHAGGSNAGSSYVFVRSGVVWTQQAKLLASDAAADDQFGFAVALSGDTAVVGAPVNDDAGDASGSAYVFVRTGTVWTQPAKVTASDAAAGDQFGYSVAVSGDTALVGAYFDDHAGGTDAGSAYVFVRSGGVWTQQANLTASDAAQDDYFGVSVAVSDDTAVVGAFGDDHAGGIDAGSGYVFDLGCDTDGDGVVNINDVCPNNASGLPVDCTGRPLRDANGDCLVDGADIQIIVDELLNQ